jgi:hypothetical protein
MALQRTAEVFELLHETALYESKFDERAALRQHGVTFAQDETVPVRVSRIFRIESHDAEVECCNDIRDRERAPR